MSARPRVDIALRRLRNQRLVGTPFARPEDAVAWLGAAQAQDYGGAKWAIGQRLKNCVDADIERAYNKGRILRTHLMRPTWHFVTPADIHWLLALTSPRVQAVNAGRYRQLELDAVTLKRSKRIFEKGLRHGEHLTRRQLASTLEAAGIDTTGQRMAYMLMNAELDALIGSGAMRGKQHTYALLAERAPGAATRPRDDALCELTVRYFRSHGPALVHDFAWWSGLTIADGKRGIEMAGPSIVSDVIDGKTYWSAPPSRQTSVKATVVHLLPNYDECIVAYRDHGPTLDRALPADTAILTDAFARHIITRDGKAIGGWHRTSAKDQIAVHAQLLVAISAGEREALRSAAERLGLFVGMPVTLALR